MSVQRDGKDRNGKLVGVALEAHNRREAELAAALTARSDVEALARMVALLAARMTRLPAPDALRVVAGRDGQEDALSVLRAAGLSTEPQRRTWEAERPAQRQVSTTPDPEHSAEAMSALREGGVEAYRAVVAGMHEARAAERVQRQAGNSVLWETRTGEQVTEGQGTGQPLRQQVSRPYHDGGAA